MNLRFTSALLPLLASVAWAANDPTRSTAESPRKDGYRLAVMRPGAAAISATAGAASLPASSGVTESLGAPLDCSPIPAYAPPPAGPSQRVSGQCFVVTDGGQRVKLDRVKVSIYPQREFEWYAQMINARARARFEGLKSVACPDNFAALSVSEMDHSLAVAEGLRRDLHVVWQDLPPADASVQTDTNGRFSVTHDVAPPYIVFAVGSRTVGHEIEYYRWQISSRVITNPSQVELSNDALR